MLFFVLLANSRVNQRSSSENVFNRKYFFFKTVSPDALLDTSISSQSELRGVFTFSNLVGSLEFGFAEII